MNVSRRGGRGGYILSKWLAAREEEREAAGERGAALFAVH